MIIERRIKNGEHVDDERIDGLPRMFIMSNFHRVFLARDKPQIKNFKWPIPEPPPGHRFAFVVIPTVKQLAQGCTCPGIRHNKSYAPCALNPKLMDGKAAGPENEPNLYTTSGGFAGTINITDRRSNLCHRISLVTYRSPDDGP